RFALDGGLITRKLDRIATQPSHDPLIEVQDLRRSFDSGLVQALRGVSFTVGRGEFVSLMGPSGSGKTTLLNVLGALDNDFDGSVRIGGSELRALECPERFRARTIGFIFQSFHLLPALTAIENVQIPMFERDWSAKERRGRAAALLESVGLRDRMSHLPSELSGGERQRVAIARSLANEPKLLLADEPTGNLDSGTAETILTLLRSVHDERQTTLIVVTHDCDVAAASGRIIRLRDGQVIADSA
ncbi:MAG TPA: ABC transporter ATP-binding protein, partial [Chthoniobacterales bacterium]|nr:ABC transporter ATP-binding protein [Chthoniobacterales bacterium]